MTFHEVQFPTDISFGAVGGAEFKTTIVTLDSGHVRRNIDWSIARGEWDVVHGLEDQADIDALTAFFRAREGRAHGFRFKDWSDFDMARQSIGATDGSTAEPRLNFSPLPSGSGIFFAQILLSDFGLEFV